MPPISVLIKPASYHCNMACSYCFYKDVASSREEQSLSFMKIDTIKTIVKKVFEASTGFSSFSFQGGEPTLVGLEFYIKFIEFVNKYNKNNIPVYFSIQTNGYLINKSWAKFFKDKNFLVGISLDGTKDIHNSLRIDNENNPTYDNVIAAINLLKKCNVEYNILTVVTKAIANNIDEIYKNYAKNGFIYQQYIPCLEPMGEKLGSNDYSLDSESYGIFLSKLFKLWSIDVLKGKIVSIRYFDELVNIVAGYPPKSCDMKGLCSIQNIIESDGSVYPCDFYAIDRYMIGNILEVSFSDIIKSKISRKFINESIKKPDECNNCQWFYLCKGGCRRHWEPIDKGNLSNYFCKSYKVFFEASYETLILIRDKYKKS